MARYVIAPENIKYGSDYKNVPYFTSTIERDAWINKYLFNDGNYLMELDSAKEVAALDLSSLTNNIEIVGFEPKIVDKNYLIVLQNEVLSFWFINQLDFLGNSNKWNAYIEFDVIMNNYNIFNELKGMSLIKGHSDTRNYLENSYDLPTKVLETISPINREFKNEIYNQANNTSWYIVFQSIKGDELGVEKITKGKVVSEPFKIYLAPLNPLYDANGGSSQTIIFDKILGGDKIFAFQSFEEQNFNFTTPNNNDLKIITSVKDQEDNFTYETILKKDWLPQSNGDKKMFILNFAQNPSEVSQADYVNQTIYEEGNSTLALQIEEKLPGAGNFTNKWYDVFWITKIDSSNYIFSNVTNEEFGNVMPFAYYKDESDQLRRYKDLTTTEYVGKITSENHNTSFIELYDLVEGYWSVDNLNKFYSTTQDSTIITAKKTNFNPLITSQESGIFNSSLVKNISFDTTNNCYKLDYINYDISLEINKFSIPINSLSNIEKIDGILQYEIVYENNKVIKIDPNLIDNDSLSFKYYASFTPEWEERTRFFTSKYTELTNENNSWTNDKEFTKATNNWEIYKTTSPISSKLAPIKDFNSIGKGVAKGAIIGPKAAITGGFLGATQASANVISRQDLKRQPENISGSGDALGDIIFNLIGDRFGLVKYKFIGSSRDFIINDIKRNGVVYNVGLFVDLYEDIKRPYYNFMQVDNFEEAYTGKGFKYNVKDKLNEILSNGTRIWNDVDNYLNFDVDNGD